jgi:hypothetical protein
MGDIYSKALYDIKQNKAVKDSGKLLAIPFHRMPKLSTFLPGIRKGVYSCITAGVKESKSQFTLFLMVCNPIEYLYANPKCGLDLKVLFFALEMSKEETLMQVMCYRLFTEYGILISPANLQSMFRGYTIDDSIIKILESDEFKDFMTFFESKVEIIDSIRSPTGIHIICEKYAKDNGKVVYDEVEWGDGVMHKVIKEYIPDRPEEIVEVIVDHATLLGETGKTLYECIKMLSSNYFLRLKKSYGMSPVLVQQQSSDSTSQQFTNRGDTILDKVKPSREGLSSMKDTAMDVNLMIGIFSPYKYKESTYEDWDLTRLRDYHRELSIMINRNGKSNITMQIFFNGASSYFKELPYPATPEQKSSVYQYAEKWRNKELEYTQ